MRGEEREYSQTQLRIQERCCDDLVWNGRLCWFTGPGLSRRSVYILKKAALLCFRCTLHSSEWPNESIQSAFVMRFITFEHETTCASYKWSQNIHKICHKGCQDKPVGGEAFSSPRWRGGRWTAAGSFSKLWLITEGHSRGAACSVLSAWRSLNKSFI